MGHQCYLSPAEEHQQPGLGSMKLPVHSDFNAIPIATHHAADSMASQETAGLEGNAGLLPGFAAQA